MYRVADTALLPLGLSLQRIDNNAAESIAERRRARGGGRTAAAARGRGRDPLPWTRSGRGRVHPDRAPPRRTRLSSPCKCALNPPRTLDWDAGSQPR